LRSVSGNTMYASKKVRRDKRSDENSIGERSRSSCSEYIEKKEVEQGKEVRG